MMPDVSSLPHFQAACNSIAAILLIAGYTFIKKGDKKSHKAAMLAALATSGLFLISYLYYHYSIGGSKKFTGEGFVRPVYFGILLTHTILAVAMLPMILVTLFRAAKENFEAHKRIAKYTLPIWIYVSVTGVMVYWFVYRLYP